MSIEAHIIKLIGDIHKAIKYKKLTRQGMERTKTRVRPPRRIRTWGDPYHNIFGWALVYWIQEITQCLESINK